MDGEAIDLATAPQLLRGGVEAICRARRVGQQLGERLLRLRCDGRLTQVGEPASGKNSFFQFEPRPNGGFYVNAEFDLPVLGMRLYRSGLYDWPAAAASK